MRLLARFPTLAAWIVALALIGVATVGVIRGVGALQTSAPANMDHVHGVIVATRGNDEFAVQMSAHTKPVWFCVAHGAHISFAHVLRHLHEHAPTDIYYETQTRGLPVAWIAD